MNAPFLLVLLRFKTFHYILKRFEFELKRLNLHKIKHFNYENIFVRLLKIKENAP